MTVLDGGGQAFPIPSGINRDGDNFDPTPGMALRDYFAAAALTGLIQRGTITDMPLLAEKAWGAADWMIAERFKVKP